MPGSEAATGVSLQTEVSLRSYAYLMWALTALFTLRVLGQAVQRWLPQPFLPDFHEFQGSTLPYWALLSAQAFILVVMSRISWRTGAGTLRPRRRIGNVLAWLGGLYMCVSLARPAIGLLLPGAPSWFTAWIPAAFHVVLATFVVTLSRYHLSEPRRSAAAS